MYKVLEPEQLARARRRRRFPQRRLDGRLIVLFWILRVYVLVMVAIIGYRAWVILGGP